MSIWSQTEGFSYEGHSQAHIEYNDGLMQDCSFSIANTLEIAQCCFKPSKFHDLLHLLFKW